MDCSIIIATYKRPETLQKTLQGLADLNTHNYKIEIIVVDNGSDKTTEELVNRYTDIIPVRYEVEPRKGKNFAVNKGIASVKGDIVVYMDDDAVPAEDWLSEIMEGVERWPNDSIFGTRILPLWPEGKELKWKFNDSFYRPAFVVADWDLPEGPYDAGKVWGPTMIFRRKIIDSGHRFNTEIGPKGGKGFIIGDETEFTKRLEKLGYRSIFLSGVVVNHQIRPEQLTKKWLYRRAFIIGRTEAFEEEVPAAAQLFGAPRYLYKILIEAGIRRVLSTCLFRENEAVNWGVKFHYFRGRIYQYINH